MMGHIKTFVVTATAFFILATSVAIAQQPSHPHDATQQAPASPSRPGMPAQGSDAPMMQHMEMCRQMMMGHPGMMGGGMGPGMMGGEMMGMPMMMSGDPKQQAEMMAMRGEMMKAMGEIMMKYAQRAHSSK
jgi:hypothetical protein